MMAHCSAVYVASKGFNSRLDPLANAGALHNDAVHLYVCLSVCLSVCLLVFCLFCLMQFRILLAGASHIISDTLIELSSFFGSYSRSKRGYFSEKRGIEISWLVGRWSWR